MRCCLALLHPIPAAQVQGDKQFAIKMEEFAAKEAEELQKKRDVGAAGGGGGGGKGRPRCHGEQGCEGALFAGIPRA